MLTRHVLKKLKVFNSSTPYFLHDAKSFSSVFLKNSVLNNTIPNFSCKHFQCNNFCSKSDPPSKSSTEEPYKSQSEIEIEEELKDLNEKGYEYILEKNREQGFKFLTWKKSLFAVILMGAVGLFFLNTVDSGKQSRIKKKGKSHGEELIKSDGDWEMYDHDGNKVSNEDFKGKYQLVYFGFTFCPDVCPRELNKMAQALNILESNGFLDDIVPLFVSVDPKRDSPPLVKKFIRQFHPKIVGLTGTPKQVAEFATMYRAYFSTPGPNDSNEDYIIDHVTMMYLINREGKYLGHISTLDDSVSMAQKLMEKMDDVKGKSGVISKLFRS